MGISSVEIITMCIGTFSLLIWLIFFIIGLKYNSIFDTLSEKEYPLKEIYGIGYAILMSFKYKYKSKSDRNIKQKLEILFEKTYSEFYLRVIRAEQITISFTLCVLGFILFGISDEILLVFMGMFFSGISYYYFGTIVQKKILARSDEILNDFSVVVSKLALLTNAGMILREAWEETAKGGSNTIYIEMQKVVEKMDNGMSEIDALYDFGIRCVIPEIKKFTSTIIQGVTKGNREISLMLQQQSKEVWNMKKQNVRRVGEKAASKLLIPICIMFVGILIMIIIPIFANMGNI